MVLGSLLLGLRPISLRIWGVAMRSLVNRSGLIAGQGQTHISYHPWGQHGSHDVVWVTPSPSPNISHTTPLRPQTPFIWG